MSVPTPPQQTTPPAPPQRSDPANFSARGDAFLSWMVRWYGELNDGAAGLIKWIKDRAEGVEADAATATAGASTATAKASEAAVKATAAAASASTSSTKADAASSSAAAAAASASTASAKSLEASSSATAAASSATTSTAKAAEAAASATDAATSASSANTKASQAGASATNAASSATTAAAKAAEATDSATSAAASATIATDKATEAADSATAAAIGANTSVTKAAEAQANAAAAAASAAQAASSAQAATDGGIRYDTSQSLTASQKVVALANIGLTEKLGVASGIATLDTSGKVPASQLPSFVDDVVEVENFTALPSTGEAGKIYSTLSGVTVGSVVYKPNRTYRWGGTSYIEMNPSPGTTADVPEGGVNLYFTVDRARAAFSGSSSVSFDQATGKFSVTLPTKLSELSNDVGFVTSSGARTALSFTAGSGAYNASTGTITIPTNTSHLTNGAGFISGITGAMVNSALGYTPYSSSNPSGFITASGTAANVSGTVAIANGGTGATSAQAANRNLTANSWFRETNNGTMVAGNTYSVYTGGGAITMYLPTFANTNNGDKIYIENLHLYWATNNFTIARSDANTQIMMLGENLVCNVNVASIVLTCHWKDGTAAYWGVTPGG